MKRLLIRIFLGAIFLVAAFPKMAHPDLFASQVAAYQMVPSRMVTLVAVVLPRIELLAALGLLVGFLARSSALWAGVLSLGFALGSTSALARGLQIDCGCFPVPIALTWAHPVADLALAMLALVIVRRGPGALALDARLR